MNNTTGASGATTDLFSTLLRKENKRKKRWAAVERFITATIAGILHAFISGYFLMISVGIAHQHWIPALPTIGYWWAVLLVWLLTGVFSPIKTDKKNDGGAQ